MVATVLFNSTTIRLSSWVHHRDGCHCSLQFYNDPFTKLDVATVLFNSTTIRLSSWMCRHRGCHCSLQFYNDPFIKLNVSSSWLPLFFSILQRSVYEAGCVIVVATVVFNSTVIRLSSWICHHHGWHCSLQFYSDPFVSIFTFRLLRYIR